jgi:HSP20 family molecular chaperone IbpA
MQPEGGRAIIEGARKGGGMAMLTWAPFRELDLVERRMRRMLDPEYFVPAADIYEKNGEFVVQLEVPGFDENDLGIEITDHTLTVKGERKVETEKAEKSFYLHERFENAFVRSFELPAEVDAEHMKAEFAKGVLEVRAPKAEALLPKQVPIVTA